MTEINKGAQSYIDSLRWGNDELSGRLKKTQTNDELSQQDFFALITQQLAAQDPFKPADNSDMVAQMVAMSTTESLGDMNDAIKDLRDVMTSNQALQASSLIGKRVLLPTEKAELVQGEPVTGVAVLGEKDVVNMRVSIENEQGAVVRVLNYNGKQTGNVEIEWDGKDNNGKDVPQGLYKFKAAGLNESKGAEYPVVMHGRVESVTLGNKDTPSAVRVSGLGGYPLKDVLEIVKS